MSKTLTELVNERRSIRSFDKKEVPNDVLQRVVEKINLCPTAGNKQSYFVYVVKSPELIKAAGKATGQGWVESVPCLLVFCCECKDSYYGKRGLELFALQDASIAQTFAILALQEEGLKSCWVGGFSESRVSSALSIPNHLRPVGLLPCGYCTNPITHERTRRSLDDTFVFV